MTDLSYPGFPVRPLLGVGLALLGLGAAAIAVNRSGPDAAACAAAATRVMAARDATVAAMDRAGAASIPACRGLTPSEFASAVDRANLIEYGTGLPTTPLPAQLPPPAYRARRARSELGRR